MRSKDRLSAKLRRAMKRAKFVYIVYLVSQAAFLGIRKLLIQFKQVLNRSQKTAAETVFWETSNLQINGKIFTLRWGC